MTRTRTPLKWPCLLIFKVIEARTTGFKGLKIHLVSCNNTTCYVRTSMFAYEEEPNELVKYHEYSSLRSIQSTFLGEIIYWPVMSLSSLGQVLIIVKLKLQVCGVVIDGRTIYHLPLLSKLINHTLKY